ncbi:uncharacterized protein N0V89_004518 [Didymosphaeria variabile]|uniref:Uncharacterized protein n=1 Tax=Didymosphaeria variabile TaxID=1932322 RepID=A0A9W9CCH0_9PLEO|nr:uncharacterized protein N0V89_004518 [Didymosphaeria variabile]KAJ4356484.1 hypothetical protein N0V89_004518 [Didymosphaeria variabile]
MRLFTTALMCLGLALTVAAAGIPPPDVVVTPTSAIGGSTDVPTPTDKEPNLIDPNMAPIVSDTPAPHIPPPGTCGQAIWVPFLGSVWIQANACHRFGDAGDIPAPSVEFINEGYSNCKICVFWKGKDCKGDVAWMGKIPSSSFTVKFTNDNYPYSYFCSN